MLVVLGALLSLNVGQCIYQSLQLRLQLLARPSSLLARLVLLLNLGDKRRVFHNAPVSLRIGKGGES